MDIPSPLTKKMAIVSVAANSLATQAAVVPRLLLAQSLNHALVPALASVNYRQSITGRFA